MDALGLFLEAIFELAVPGGGGGGKGRTWSLHKKFGWALTIVLFAMATLGMWLFASTLNSGNEVGALLWLLLPFGSTYLAGLAGDRGAENARKAATLSTVLALAGGVPLWLMLTVLGLLTWQ